MAGIPGVGHAGQAEDKGNQGGGPGDICLVIPVKPALTQANIHARAACQGAKSTPAQIIGKVAHNFPALAGPATRVLFLEADKLALGILD